MPTSPVSRAHASAMCTAAASWRTCTSSMPASSAASKTGMMWLPDSVKMRATPAWLSAAASASAPRALRAVMASRRRGFADQGLARLHAREAYRFPRELETLGGAAHHHVFRLRERAGLREVLAVVGAARILACERRGGDHAAHGDEAREVHPVVPAQVEDAVAVGDTGARERIVQRLQAREPTAEPLRGTQDAHIVPHAVMELVADGAEISRRERERLLVLGDTRGDRACIGVAITPFARHPRRHGLARDAAVNGGVGDTIAAQTIRAMHAAGVFAG